MWAFLEVFPQITEDRMIELEHHCFATPNDKNIMYLMMKKPKTVKHSLKCATHTPESE